MNKFFLSLIGLILMIASLKLNAEATNTFEIRAAAFIHQSKKFRNIYDRVNMDYQLESTFAFNESFEIWGELDYMSTSKKKECYSTKVNLANSSVGVLYIYSFLPNLDGYIGTGLSMTRVNLRNRSCCDHDKESKLAWGSLSKAGLRYWFYKNTFLDVFVDYLYQEVHFQKKVNVGGVKLGGGLGIRF